MATESKQRKKFVAPLLPAMLVKEKVKRKLAASSSPQKLKKLRLTKCCKPENSVNNGDCKIHFFSLSQPPPIAKKVKSKFIKSNNKHSVTRAQMPALLEVNLSNNNHESNICNKTERGLKNPIDEDAVSSSDLLQSVSPPKDEFSKCGEKTCTSYELMKEKLVDGKISPDLGNANNIVQNENKSAEFTVEAAISSEIMCDVNEQSAEVKLGNYCIDSLQCNENLLSEHDIRQYNGNIQQGAQTKQNMVIDPITNTSMILQSSETEICNQAKFQKKATAEKKLCQSLLDTLNTVCTTEQSCLVQTPEHNANNINSEDGFNKLLTKLDSQEELKMQNRNTKQNASSETHESYVKEEPSDGEFSDIVGNSQDDGIYPILQLTINNSLIAHHNPNTFKVDMPQICSSELSNTQTTLLVSPHKIKQMTKANNADKKVSVVGENKCHTEDNVCEDNNFSDNFSHLLLKQEIELQDETSTLNSNQDDKNEVLPDRKLKDKTQQNGKDNKNEVILNKELKEETQQNGKDNKNELIPDKKLKDETQENNDNDNENELILDSKLKDETQENKKDNKNELIPNKKLKYETQENDDDSKNELILDSKLKDETHENMKENKNELIPDRKLKYETQENEDNDNNNELILDRKLNDKKPQKCDNDERENFQLEPIQWEDETFFKEVKISDVANAEESGCKTQTKSEICVKNIGQQNTLSESIATTSYLVANLDDDLEISTSQLLELENEFDSMATQRDNPELHRSEPTTAIRSLLPRQIRAPTVDWTQRTEYNRQRLQSIIQDICKLNALLARARRMMWKQ